jgi:hypothetical protein
VTAAIIFEKPVRAHASAGAARCVCWAHAHGPPLGNYRSPYTANGILPVASGERWGSRQALYTIGGDVRMYNAARRSRSAYVSRYVSLAV